MNTSSNPNYDYDGGAKMKRKRETNLGSRVSDVHSTGLDKLDKFDKSTHALEKQNQIRKMAKILSKVLGITGDVDKMSISDIQKKVKSTVPNNPKAWRVQNDKQHELCITLSQAVNAIAGRDIISSKLPTHEICDKSAEFINSLFTGMNSEFITISRDVKERVDAIETLLKLLESGRSKVEVTGNKMQVTDPEFKPLLRLMDEVIKELNFQLSHLRNILNVSVMPTEAGLMSLFERQAVLKNFLDRTQSTQPGTQAYGSRLVSVLNSLELVTSATDLVHNALKDIGMSVAEYKKIDTYDELESKLLDHLARISKNSPTYVIFDKFYRAAEVLRRNDYRRETISKAIAGGFSSTGGYDGGLKRHKLAGGKTDKMYEDDGAVKNEYAINPQDRMTKVEKTREHIVETYVTKLEGQFDQFFTAVDQLAMKFGVSVKLNKDLDMFIKTLEELADLPALRDDTNDKPSSFIKNVLGMENQIYEVGKDTFLSQLNKIKSSLKNVSGDTKDANMALSNIIGFTDEVYDLIRTTMKIKVYNNPTSYSGGRVKNISISTYDELKKFILGLRRRVFTARIKENFKMVDTSVFNKEYENMLGKFMAAKKQRYNDAVELSMDSSGDYQLSSDNNEIGPAKNNVNVMLAVEAIDLYLGYFSDTLIKNPDDIQDILKLIEPLKQLKNSSSSTPFTSLKNFVAIFIYIGEKFGGVSLRDKTPLSPKLLFKYLSMYKKISNATNYNKNNFIDINTELELMYKLTINAMTGKILACIEGYDTIYSRNAINVIDKNVRLLVGAGSENINIIDDAFEGYIRIPLLIEFYRTVFFPNITKNPQQDFAVIPNSTSGLISNLINTIFKLGDNPVYTNEEVKLVILEVNSLYNSCTSTDKFREMLYMVVNDMNFRYGLYSLEVLDKYQNDSQQPINSKVGFPNKNLSASYLFNDQGRLDGVPNMPSSKFSEYKNNSNNIRNNVDNDNTLVNTFITKILNSMDDISITTSTGFKIDYLSKLFKEKKTKEEKFEFIKQNIQSGSNVEETKIKELFNTHYILPLFTTLFSFVNPDTYSSVKQIISFINSGLISYEVYNNKINWDLSNLTEYVDSLYKMCIKCNEYVTKVDIDNILKPYTINFKTITYTILLELVKRIRMDKNIIVRELDTAINTFISSNTNFAQILPFIQGTKTFAETDEFVSQMIAIPYNKTMSNLSVFESEGKLMNIQYGGGSKNITTLMRGGAVITETERVGAIKNKRKINQKYNNMDNKYKYMLFNPDVINSVLQVSSKKLTYDVSKTIKDDKKLQYFKSMPIKNKYKILNNNIDELDINDTLQQYVTKCLTKLLKDVSIELWYDEVKKYIKENITMCSDIILKQTEKNKFIKDINESFDNVYCNILYKCIKSTSTSTLSENELNSILEKFNRSSSIIQDKLNNMFKDYNSDFLGDGQAKDGQTDRTGQIVDGDKTGQNVVGVTRDDDVDGQTDRTGQIVDGDKTGQIVDGDKTGQNVVGVTRDDDVDGQTDRTGQIVDGDKTGQIVDGDKKGGAEKFFIDFFKDITYRNLGEIMTRDELITTIRSDDADDADEFINHKLQTETHKLNISVYKDFLSDISKLIIEYNNNRNNKISEVLTSIKIAPIMPTLYHQYQNVLVDCYYNFTEISIDNYINRVLDFSVDDIIQYIIVDNNNSTNPIVHTYFSTLNDERKTSFINFVKNSIKDSNSDILSIDINKIILEFVNNIMGDSDINMSNVSIKEHLTIYRLRNDTQDIEYIKFIIGKSISTSEENLDIYQPVLNHFIKFIFNISKYINDVTSKSGGVQLSDRETKVYDFLINKIPTQQTELERKLLEQINFKSRDMATDQEFIDRNVSAIDLTNENTSKKDSKSVLNDTEINTIKLSQTSNSPDMLQDNYSSNTKYTLNDNDRELITNITSIKDINIEVLSEKITEYIVKIDTKLTNQVVINGLIIKFLNNIKDNNINITCRDEFKTFNSNVINSIFEELPNRRELIAHLVLKNIYTDEEINTSDLLKRNTDAINISINAFIGVTLDQLKDSIDNSNYLYKGIFNDVNEKTDTVGKLFKLIFTKDDILKKRITRVNLIYNIIKTRIDEFREIYDKCVKIDFDSMDNLSKTIIINSSVNGVKSMLVAQKILISYNNSYIVNDSKFRDKVDRMTTEFRIDKNNVFAVLYDDFSNKNTFSGGGTGDKISSLINTILVDEGILDNNTIKELLDLINHGGIGDNNTIINILTDLNEKNKNTIEDLYNYIITLLTKQSTINEYDISVSSSTSSKSDPLSILGWFNSFLYSYISDVFDKNTEVVYGKLLTDFTNLAANAVYKGMGFSRTPRNGADRQEEASKYDFTQREPIDVRTALVLRRLIKEKDQKGIMSRWLIQNVSDMSSYYKDRLRMVLPYYLTHLNAFSINCKLLRELIVGYTGGNTGTQFQSKNLISQDNTDYSDVKYFMPDTKTINNNQYQWNYFNTVLIKFENYAKTLKSGITSTLRDLDDSVIVGNIYYDSINDYVNNNGIEPLILYNHNISITNILSKNSPYSYIPSSNEFKYLYMFKSLDHEKYDISRTYQILNLFNSTNNNIMSKEMFEELSRLLYKGSQGLLNAYSIIPDKNSIKDSYTSNNALMKNVEYRESSNQLKTILSDNTSKFTREQIIKQVVSELNINPVNLKALTRNIPLANIYRYANLSAKFNGKDSSNNIIAFNILNIDVLLFALKNTIKYKLSQMDTSDTNDGLMAIYD